MTDSGRPDRAAAPENRLAFLDAVRGIAALAVVLQHALTSLWPQASASLGRWFDLGNFGVVAFFLTSGFIIPVSLERGGSVPRFLLGRFFRLYPLYWFSLALVIAFHLSGLSSGHDEHERFKANVPLFGAVNATMFQTFVGVPNALQPYWTLSLELLFYGLCCAMFLAGLRGGPGPTWAVVLAVAAAGAAVPLATGSRVPMGLMFGLASMFVGTTIYRHHCGEVATRSLALLLATTAVACLPGVLVNFGLKPGQTSNTAHCVALTWGASYALFLTAYSLRRRSFFPPLLWLGRVSYSVYLIHFFVIFAVYPVLLDRLPKPVGLLAILAASLGVAELSYRWIERPGHDLGRHLQRRFWARGVPTGPAAAGVGSRERTPSASSTGDFG